MENLLPIRGVSALFMLFPGEMFPMIRLCETPWRLTLVVFAYVCALAGMFGMFLPALFFSLGTPHLSPASNTILASAELPAGLFIAMVVLAEPVTTLQWVGVGVILLAVAFSQTASRMRASCA